jgi:hypothetical protein
LTRSIVATDGSLEAKVIEAAGKGSPYWSSACAVNSCAPPTLMAAASGVRTSRVRIGGGGLIVIVANAFTPPARA